MGSGYLGERVVHGFGACGIAGFCSRMAGQPDVPGFFSGLVVGDDLSLGVGVAAQEQVVYEEGSCFGACEGDWDAEDVPARLEGGLGGGTKIQISEDVWIWC